MLRLAVGNSLCRVQGCDRALLKELQREMSYTETKMARFKFKSIRRTLVSPNGTFPTGLLYLFKDFCYAKKIAYQVDDKRVRPSLNRFGFAPGTSAATGLTFRPYLEQKAAAEAAKAFERGIISAPTGLGKSLICALLIDEFQVPTLVVVPSLKLKSQLTESLREIFGKDMVGPLTRKGEMMHLISVENVDALDPKKPIRHLDMVIIDEFHHSGAKTYRNLNNKSWEHVYYKFGLTATPFRSKSEEKLLLESVLSKVIYQIPYTTAVGSGYIVPMESYFVDMPEPAKKIVTNSYHKVYSHCIVENKERNEIIVDFAARLHLAGKSTLILVKQVGHGRLLQDMLTAQGLDIPFAHGEDEDTENMISDFNARKTNILIGTTGVIGEGVDTKPCEYVILAAGGKSKNAFMQNLGRGFRRFGDKETCKIILFSDKGHRWLKEHFKECVKYLKQEYGAVPSKLEL